MSNLVVIIANAYKEFEKNYNYGSHTIEKLSLVDKIKKNKENILFDVVSILDFIISVVIMLMSTNYVLVVIGVNVVYIAFLIVFIHYSRSACSKKCAKRYKEYITKIGLFNNVLRNTYSIDSKNKLLFLIEQCKSTQVILEHKNNLVVLLPALGTFFSILLSIKSLNISVIIILIFIFMIIIYLGFVIQSISNRLINYSSNRVKTLEYVLTDIYYCIYLNKEYKLE